MSENGTRPDFKIFSGNSNRKLADAICKELGRPPRRRQRGRQPRR